MKFSLEQLKRIEPERSARRSGQRGASLLEVLISVLIFALGIVALVGLQARSLMTTDDVQYRAEAIHFANAYMGKIWAVAGGSTGAAIKTQFETGGAGYTPFSSQVTGGIPGAQAPQVNILDQSRDITDALGNLVTINSVNVAITIQWIDREDNTIMHSYTQTSSVGLN